MRDIQRLRIRCRKTLIYILPFLLCLSGVAPAVAQGEIEQELEDARQLYQEKKYSEAIKKLSEIARTYPEAIKEAEKIMQEIRQNRQKINAKYEELLEAFDEKNHEEILKTITVFP